jgi:hypothetical protein
VEVGCVEFTTQQKTLFFFPAERRAIIATVFGKGCQIPGSVGEFEDAGEEPGAEGVGSRE